MKDRVSLEQLVALIDGDREFVSVLIEQQVITMHDDGFGIEDVDRVLASRTLVQELEVNWAGVDIILRLRSELAEARRMLAVRAADLDADGDG